MNNISWHLTLTFEWKLTWTIKHCCFVGNFIIIINYKFPVHACSGGKLKSSVNRFYNFFKRKQWLWIICHVNVNYMYNISKYPLKSEFLNAWKSGLRLPKTILKGGNRYSSHEKSLIFWKELFSEQYSNGPSIITKCLKFQSKFATCSIKSVKRLEY